MEVGRSMCVDSFEMLSFRANKNRNVSFEAKSQSDLEIWVLEPIWHRAWSGLEKVISLQS